VHLFRLACDPLDALAAREGVAVVEDAAQALGGRDGQGRPCGGGGDAGCFSFFPTKNLGAWGDAGAVVTRSEGVAARLRRLRAHGATEAYVHGEIGRNSRLDALQAAVLLAKAPRLDDWSAARERIARRYLSELAGFPLVLPAEPAAPALHAWHAFVVRTERRDALAAFLLARGVEARVYYPVPLHRQPVFASLEGPPLPAAEDVCRSALALPIFPAMREEQQAWVVDSVAAFWKR
jgi:dTDP-4-amino-4,6-dideoxygalactose transaminase